MYLPLKSHLEKLPDESSAVFRICSIFGMNCFRLPKASIAARKAASSESVLEFLYHFRNWLGSCSVKEMISYLSARFRSLSAVVSSIKSVCLENFFDFTYVHDVPVISCIEFFRQIFTFFCKAVGIHFLCIKFFAYKNQS